MAKVACTYQSLAFNFDKTCSREIETNDSMKNDSFNSFSHEHIESKNNQSNLHWKWGFRMRSRLSRSISGILGKGYRIHWKSDARNKPLDLQSLLCLKIAMNIQHCSKLWIIWVVQMGRRKLRLTQTVRT